MNGISGGTGMRRNISSLSRSACLLTTVLAAVLMYGCGAGMQVSSVFKNSSEVFFEKKAVAAGGDAQAQFEIAEAYEKGEQVSVDYAQAASWYRKAALQGHAGAMGRLGRLYEEGKGVEENKAEALNHYLKAAELGDVFAQGGAGGILYNVRKNYPEALKYLRPAADKNDPRAQYELGSMYYFGSGVKQDYTEAVRWFKPSAVQDYAPALFRLGKCYADANGVERDDAEAVRLYRRAAEQEHASAILNLGWMYSNGRGVSKDYKRAAELYLQSAEKGNARGMANIGYYYKNGIGVEKNTAEAVRWLSKGVKKGDSFAADNIQSLYESMGYGLVKHDEGQTSLQDYLLNRLNNKWNITDVKGSKNGSTVLLRIVNKQTKKAEFSLWNYDSARKEFRNGWFRVTVDEKKLSGSFDISPDSSSLVLLARTGSNWALNILREDSQEFIVLKRDNWVMTSGVNTQAFFNEAGDKIIVCWEGASSQHADYTNKYFIIYSAASGGQLAVKGDYSGTLLNIRAEPSDKFIAASVAAHNLNYFYSLPDFNEITRIYSLLPTLSGFSSDGSVIFYQNSKNSRPIQKGELGNSSEQEKFDKLKLTPVFVKSKPAFGTENRLLLLGEDYFIEGMAENNETVIINRTPVPKNAQEAIDAVYVQSDGAWHVFAENGVVRIPAANASAVKASKILNEAKKYQDAGFEQQAVSKIYEAAGIDPLLSELSSVDVYVNLSEQKMTSESIGKITIRLSEILPDESRPDLLFVYGIFAVKAGHPALAKKTAERIRQIQNMPNDNNRNTAYASVLEAMADIDANLVDRGYNLMMTNEKYIKGSSELKQAVLDYPQYFAALYKDRKKLAFLLGIDEKNLPQVKQVKTEPQVYPDISGKIIQPLPSPPLLESKPQLPLPEEPKQDKGVPKGRVLD